MGYFRVYKPSDYSADECRKKLAELEARMCAPLPNRSRVRDLANQWAQFRELLARHEGENKSRLDETGAP